jgi:putative ABC transport system ATP-binding protein
MTSLSLSAQAGVPVERPAAIRIENLSRYYKMGEVSIAALQGVSLEVLSGEFVALLGSSGSGKSTLLNMIAGLDRPSAGKVCVLDRDLGAMQSEELARHRRMTVGMIFQSFNLMPRMSLEENVELPLRLAEVDRAARPARVREALERVGLSARRAHRPSELSGGEQQRAAIARALVNRPSILVADEPTGNLDSHNGEQTLHLIRELNRTLRMTVVLVTHERPLAARFSDRIIFLRDGKIAPDEDRG